MSGFWRYHRLDLPGLVLLSFQMHYPAVPDGGFVSADIYGLFLIVGTAFHYDAHGPSNVFFSLLSVSVTREPPFSASQCWSSGSGSH